MKRIVSILCCLAWLAAPMALRADDKSTEKDTKSQGDIDLTPVKKWVAQQAALKSAIIDFKQSRFLKTVKKPLVTQGKFYYLAPGSYSWQSGNPVKTIATIKPGTGLTVQNTEKKEAEVISRTELNEKTDGHGLSFLESGFPKSFEQFQKDFEITAVTLKDPYYIVDLKFAQGSTVAVRKITLYITCDSNTLGGIHLFFRDGSRIESSFSNILSNAKVPAALFTPNLEGYSIKKSE